MDASKVITDLATTNTTARVLSNQLLAVGTFVNAASQDSTRIAYMVQSHWRILDQLSQRLDHSDAVHHQHALAITREIISQTLNTFQAINKVTPLRRTSSPSSSTASSRASSSASTASLSSVSSTTADAATSAKSSPFSFLSSRNRPSSSRSSSSQSVASAKSKGHATSNSTGSIASNTSVDYVFPLRNRMQWVLKKVEVDALLRQLEFLQQTAQLLALVLTIGEKIKWTRQFAKGGNSMQVMYEVLKVQGIPAKIHLQRDIKALVTAMPPSSRRHDQDSEGVTAMLPVFIKQLGQKYAEFSKGETPEEPAMQEWEDKEYNRDNMRRWWTGLLLEWTTIR